LKDNQTLIYLLLRLLNFRKQIWFDIKLKNNNKIGEVPCEERKRFGGKKKVNEIVDGFKILIYILFSFLKRSQ